MPTSSPGAFMELLQWLWAPIGLVGGWIVARIRGAERDLNDHKLYSASNYMTKPEIHNLMKDTIRPMEAELHEIKSDVKAILKRGNDQ